MILLIALMLAQAPTQQAPSPAAPPQAAEKGAPVMNEAGGMARFDELWKRRDEPAAIKEMNKLIKQELDANPKSFDANWRLASLLNWQANGASDGDFKAALGKAAWTAGDKAIEARPDDVRGQYHAGTGVGLYSEGVGIMTALSQGIEGKFRARIQAALKIDKDYLDGQPQVVWGRYFYKLPWPKRDIGESIKVLREVVKTHPNNWRARIYLADSLNEDGQTPEAEKLIVGVREAKGGDDPPEEKRLKAMANQWHK